MLRTPSAWAPSSSDSRAIRFRSRVVTCTTHSRSSSCWTPNATAIAPIRTRAIAESEMLTTSAPASRSRRAASSVRSILMDRGGSISTEITKRPAARAVARPVSGVRVAASGPVASANADLGLAPDTVAGRSRLTERACDRRSSAVVRASSATRIAAMWAGVVPQQPPITPAPASSRRGTIEAKYAGSAA